MGKKPITGLVHRFIEPGKGIGYHNVEIRQQIEEWFTPDANGDDDTFTHAFGCA